MRGCPEIGCKDTQNFLHVQIGGLEKVRIMRFSGRKGDLEGVFVGIKSQRKGERIIKMNN